MKNLDFEKGGLCLRLEEVLKEKGVSKNQLCKDLDLNRTGFNKYCKNEMKRLDVNWLYRMCVYLDVDIRELFDYVAPPEKEEK